MFENYSKFMVWIVNSPISPPAPAIFPAVLRSRFLACSGSGILFRTDQWYRALSSTHHTRKVHVFLFEAENGGGEEEHVGKAMFKVAGHIT